MEKFGSNYRDTKIGETVFTIFFYFVRDKFGREYTPDEIKNKKNIKPIPSFDFIETNAKFKIYNHQKALVKFRNRINTEVEKKNLYGGFVRTEKFYDDENKLATIYNFGRDGKERYIHFPTFDSRNILIGITKNVLLSTPATKTLPIYSNINSPQKQKYEERAIKYRESVNTFLEVKKMSDNFKHLRT